jgi:outer membrane lipoprotein-sorting protein
MTRSVITLSLAMMLAGTPAPAQTVDDIVAKNLEARGGVEKLRAVQTVKTTGKMSGRGIEVSVTTWVKRPNKMRRETAFPDRTMTVGFDGSTVWALDSTTGKAQQLTGPQAEATRDQAGLDPLFLDYKEKGHRIELVGTSEQIDGQPVHHVRVTKKNSQVAHHYLSAETGLELRIVESFDQGGMKAEVRTDLSNYQTVDGMRVPFTIKQYSSGQLAVEFNLGKVEFNAPMDDEIFSMK